MLWGDTYGGKPYAESWNKYGFAFGLNFNGVIDDARVARYKGDNGGL